MSASISTMQDSVSHTAQRVWPVAATVVGEMTGFAALSESDASTTTPNDPGATEATAETAGDQDSSGESLMARDDTHEERRRGPSDAQRAHQTQQQIGTESGIPTSAGAGTTLSPDQDVAPAARNAHSSKAAVGVDYSDQPCPTSDARRSSPTSDPAEGKTTFDTDASHSNDTPRLPPTSSRNEGEAAEQHQAGGAGWKTKVAAQTKLVVGKITRDHDKVETARRLKNPDL